jgi:hypothetical protein
MSYDFIAVLMKKLLTHFYRIVGEGRQHLVLEKRSLHAFQGGIYVKDLPPTLKDAVRATRDLGLSCLWIDALCIIQDCLDDVEHEISMMQNTCVLRQSSSLHLVSSRYRTASWTLRVAWESQHHIQ